MVMLIRYLLLLLLLLLQAGVKHLKGATASEAIAVSVQLSSNSCMCCLKLQRWQQAIAAANEVLSKEPQNPKVRRQKKETEEEREKRQKETEEGDRERHTNRVVREGDRIGDSKDSIKGDSRRQ